MWGETGDLSYLTFLRNHTAHATAGCWKREGQAVAKILWKCYSIFKFSWTCPVFWGAKILYTRFLKTLCVFPGFPALSGPSRSYPANQNPRIWNSSKYCKPAPCASNHLQMCNVVCSVHAQEVQHVWKVLGLLCTCRRSMHIDFQTRYTEMPCTDSKKGHMGNFDTAELCCEGCSSLWCFKHYTSMSFSLGIFLKYQ